MGTSKYLDPEGMLKLIDGYLKTAGPTFQLKATSKYLRLTAKNIEVAIHAHDRGKKYAVHSTQFPNEFLKRAGRSEELHHQRQVCGRHRALPGDHRGRPEGAPVRLRMGREEGPPARRVRERDNHRKEKRT